MSLKHITLAGTATVGPKGQVVIPVECREKMGIVPGDKLITLYVEDKQSVVFVTERQAQTIIDRFDSHISELRDVMKTGEADEK